MKSASLLLFLAINASCEKPKPVYVCDSSGAKRYHNDQHCRGLSSCTYRIVKITEDEAKKRGKTLCHWEIKAR